MLRGIPHTVQGTETRREPGRPDFRPAPGDTFRGTVVKAGENGDFLILARGGRFQAIATRPLEPGHNYLFQVRSTGERLLLKVVEGESTDRTSAVRLWASGRNARAEFVRILGSLAGRAHDPRLPPAVRDTLARLDTRIPAAVYRGPQADGVQWLTRQLRESGLFLEGRAARFILQGDGPSLQSLGTSDLKGILLALKAALGHADPADPLVANLTRQAEQGLQTIQQDQMLNLSSLKDGLGWFWFIPGDPEDGFRHGEVFVRRPETEGEETFLSLSLDFTHLGHLDAALSMTRSGLGLRILVEDGGIADFLGDHLDDLRGGLARAGLNTGTITCRRRRTDDPEWTPFLDSVGLSGAVDVRA